jgi:hypothetical protein
MDDGIIKENIVESITSSSSGGGVYNSGIFIMNGMDIVIEDNTVNSEIYVGGGIGNSGTFIMNAGTIKRNKTLLTLPNHAPKGMAGGGIYNGGTFTMNGGTIGGNPSDANTAANGANGVYGSSGFTMSGGIITGNTAAGTNNYGVYIWGGSFTMTESAQVTQDNVVFLRSASTIAIDGALANSPTANIVRDSSSPGTKLLKASSSALFTENYNKFLYNGAPDHINSSPVIEGGFWYGVYQ